MLWKLAVFAFLSATVIPSKQSNYWARVPLDLCFHRPSRIRQQLQNDLSWWCQSVATDATCVIDK